MTTFNELAQRVDTVSINLKDSTERAVYLVPTYYGDYVGSIIERSNFEVVCEELIGLFGYRIPLYTLHDLCSAPLLKMLAANSTRAIIVKESAPQFMLDYVVGILDKCQDYPVLDDEHLSTMTSNDLYESFMERYGLDIVHCLVDEYGIGDVDLEDLYELLHTEEFTDYTANVDETSCVATYPDITSDECIQKLAKYLA